MNPCCTAPIQASKALQPQMTQMNADRTYVLQRVGAPVNSIGARTLERTFGTLLSAFICVICG